MLANDTCRQQQRAGEFVWERWFRTKQTRLALGFNRSHIIIILIVVVGLLKTTHMYIDFRSHQVMFDGSGVAYQPTELFHIFCPNIGVGFYAPPVAGELKIELKT